MITVCVDNSFLLYLMGFSVPPVSNWPERLVRLKQNLSSEHIQLVIPAIAIGEILAYIPQHARRKAAIRSLKREKRVSVQPFSYRAAVEYAEIVQRSAKKKLAKADKYDAQIFAIAKVCSAQALYASDDFFYQLAHDDDNRMAIITPADI